ncbi:hypothetical protein Fmac_014260 [Flemingia macrophylla]|uniref:Plant bHLH transcription factor ACT-like domain-containing protein n=1 Tax=Flemingia macrophylla TaxID=520843 RepID=A0ABD1MBQ7_9FABA
MVSRVHKRTAMYRNLQLLRSIRHSHSVISLKHLFLPLVLHAIFTSIFNHVVIYRDFSVFMQHRKGSASLDLSNYIQGLKQKLQELNQLTPATARKFVDYDPMPKLEVEAQEEGFVIKVLSQSSCQGLLVFILEAFEELGLDVLQARVSCADSFSLEALANKENYEDTRPLDAQIVEQVVSQAIQNWKEVSQI